jgi:hypothetical protein
MPLTFEQLTLAAKAFRSFRLNASEALFEKIFGETEATHFWRTFHLRYGNDVIGFFGYLDDAYTQVFLNYLLTSIIPRIEGAAKSQVATEVYSC